MPRTRRPLPGRKPANRRANLFDGPVRYHLPRRPAGASIILSPTCQTRINASRAARCSAVCMAASKPLERTSPATIHGLRTAVRSLAQPKPILARLAAMAPTNAACDSNVSAPSLASRGCLQGQQQRQERDIGNRSTTRSQRVEQQESARLCVSRPMFKVWPRAPGGAVLPRSTRCWRSPPAAAHVGIPVGDQQFDRFGKCCSNRLIDRSQLRLGKTRDRRIVEADQRQIIGNSSAHA